MASILDGLSWGGDSQPGLLDSLPPWLRETLAGVQGSMPPNGIATAGYGQFPGQPPAQPQRQPQQPGIPMPQPSPFAQQQPPQGMPQQAPQMPPGGLPARTPFGQSPKVDGMGDRLYEALGGFLGNEGLIGGGAAAIKTLATGEVTNPYALQKRQQMETYAALQRDFGMTEPQARMAMQNPEVMKAFIPRIAPKYQFKDTGENYGGFDQATGKFTPQGPSPKQTGFHIVGYDEQGKAKYGWVGKQPGEITPYHVPGTPGDATFQDPNDPNVGQLAQGLTGNDYVEALAKVSPGRAALLKKIGSGEIPFPSGRYLQSQAGMQLMEDLARFEPGSDATHFASRFGTRKDFTSGKSAQNLTSFNTVISHLDTLHSTIDGLKNSSSPIYNKAANWLATNTGDTKYQENFKKFDTARQAVTAELTRAFRGTGGNVADIKDWNAKLDAADSPESLKAAVNSAIELLKGRIDAVGDQYNRGMKSSKEPLELLSPKAQEAIKRLEATTASGTSAAPAAPKRVRQNGHVYEQQPDGSYKPVQ